MDLGIQGKKALVCASSRGLGRAIAECLAREGAELFLTGRDETTLADAAADIERQTGRKPMIKAVDMSVVANVEELVSEVSSRFGTIDILINNIGGPSPSAAHATETEQWQQGFDQIFQSAVTLTRRLLPAMQEKKFGRIITVTSLSVVEPIDHLAVSTAMRAAVTAFHKNLATEVAASGVTCHTVMPGVIHTQRIENLRSARAERQGTTLAEEMEKTKQTIPMGRLGRPEELADVVAFLCSVRASYVTGLNLAVDGGLRKGF